MAITEHVSNDLLQAAFSQTDLFDLRFNEKREIDGKILEKMKSDGFKPLNFDKVHVFYIADTREDVENESSLKLIVVYWKSCIGSLMSQKTNYVIHIMSLIIGESDVKMENRHLPRLLYF